MTKRNDAAAPEAVPAPEWRARHQAAYRAAEQEIARLPPGEATLYHEGNLVVDAGNNPEIAGRAAAFRDASQADQGTIAQRRLGFERYQYIFWRTRDGH